MGKRGGAKAAANVVMAKPEGQAELALKIDGSMSLGNLGLSEEALRLVRERMTVLAGGSTLAPPPSPGPTADSSASARPAKASAPEPAPPVAACPSPPPPPPPAKACQSVLLPQASHPQPPAQVQAPTPAGSLSPGTTTPARSISLESVGSCLSDQIVSTPQTLRNLFPITPSPSPRHALDKSVIVDDGQDAQPLCPGLSISLAETQPARQLDAGLSREGSLVPGAASFNDLSTIGTLTKAVSPDEASAAMLASPPAFSRSTRKVSQKAAGADDILPNLSPEEQSRYKSWWGRFRSSSSISSELLNTDTEEEAPARECPQLVPPCAPLAPATAMPVATPARGNHVLPQVEETPVPPGLNLPSAYYVDHEVPVPPEAPGCPEALSSLPPLPPAPPKEASGTPPVAQDVPSSALVATAVQPPTAPVAPLPPTLQVLSPGSQTPTPPPLPATLQVQSPGSHAPTGLGAHAEIVDSSAVPLCGGESCVLPATAAAPVTPVQSPQSLGSQAPVKPSTPVLGGLDSGMMATVVAELLLKAHLGGEGAEAAQRLACELAQQMAGSSSASASATSTPTEAADASHPAVLPSPAALPKPMPPAALPKPMSPAALPKPMSPAALPKAGEVGLHAVATGAPLPKATVAPLPNALLASMPAPPTAMPAALPKAGEVGLQAAAHPRTVPVATLAPLPNAPAASVPVPPTGMPAALPDAAAHPKAVPVATVAPLPSAPSMASMPVPPTAMPEVAAHPKAASVPTVAPLPDAPAASTPVPPTAMPAALPEAGGETGLPAAALPKAPAASTPVPPAGTHAAALPESAATDASVDSTPAPPVAMAASPVPPCPPPVGPTDVGSLPPRVNSSTHPSEWKSFQRFCDRHPSAGEVQRAWKGSAALRMATFAKFVQAGCQGMALEAAMRMRRQKEEKDKDSGEYYTWSFILAFHDNNLAKASDFAQRRRGEIKGTSTDRNSGEETFLYYDRQKRSVTHKTVDEIAFEVGCDPALAANLAASWDSSCSLAGPSGNGSTGTAPPQSSSADPKPSKTTGERPNKKARAPKPEGSELEPCLAGDAKKFVASWISAATTAQGTAARIKAQLEILESQEILMGLIETSAQGIAAARKQLQQMVNPTDEQVNAVLQTTAVHVESFKKHCRVANNLIASEKREREPRPSKKAKKGQDGTDAAAKEN